MKLISLCAIYLLSSALPAQGTFKSSDGGGDPPFGGDHHIQETRLGGEGDGQAVIYSYFEGMGHKSIDGFGKSAGGGHGADFSEYQGPNKAATGEGHRPTYERGSYHHDGIGNAGGAYDRGKETAHHGHSDYNDVRGKNLGKNNYPNEHDIPGGEIHNQGFDAPKSLGHDNYERPHHSPSDQSSYDNFGHGDHSAAGEGGIKSPYGPGGPEEYNHGPTGGFRENKDKHEESKPRGNSHHHSSLQYGPTTSGYHSPAPRPSPPLRHVQIKPHSSDTHHENEPAKPIQYSNVIGSHGGQGERTHKAPNFRPTPTIHSHELGSGHNGPEDHRGFPNKGLSHDRPDDIFNHRPSSHPGSHDISHHGSSHPGPHDISHHGSSHPGSHDISHHGSSHPGPHDISHHGSSHPGPHDISHHGSSHPGPHDISHHGSSHPGPQDISHHGPSHPGSHDISHHGPSYPGPQDISHHGPSHPGPHISLQGRFHSGPQQGSSHHGSQNQGPSHHRSPSHHVPRQQGPSYHGPHQQAPSHNVPEHHGPLHPGTQLPSHHGFNNQGPTPHQGPHNLQQAPQHYHHQHIGPNSNHFPTVPHPLRAPVHHTPNPHHQRAPFSQQSVQNPQHQQANRPPQFQQGAIPNQPFGPIRAHSAPSPQVLQQPGPQNQGLHVQPQNQVQLVQRPPQQVVPLLPPLPPPSPDQQFVPQQQLVQVVPQQHHQPQVQVVSQQHHQPQVQVVSQQHHQPQVQVVSQQHHQQQVQLLPQQTPALPQFPQKVGPPQHLHIGPQQVRPTQHLHIVPQQVGPPQHHHIGPQQVGSPQQPLRVQSQPQPQVQLVPINQHHSRQIHQLQAQQQSQQQPAQQQQINRAQQQQAHQQQIYQAQQQQMQNLRQQQLQHVHQQQIGQQQQQG